MNINLIIILFILIGIIYIKNNKENFSIIKKVKEHFNNNDFSVYLIHMKKNSDRLINFEKYYNNSDMALKKIEIFPAVVGKNLNLLNFVTPGGYEQILMTEKTNQRKYHYEITRGAVGCYLSHLSIYKKIIESNLNYGIIFEDDSIIANDFYQKLLYGLNVVPPDWDIFLLGMICLKCDISKDYVKVNRFWGTHGYIIKKESAVKILSYLDKPISKQIDADLSLLIKKNLINVYAINPMIVIQDPKFKSDIQMKVIDSPEAFNEEFAQQQLMKFYAKNRIKN